MANNNLVKDSYKFINSKIMSLKETYPFLRDKTLNYVFSVLCVKSNIFKNPSFTFTEKMMDESIVDGTNDGGVDVLLTDPNSDESNLILAQSKYYSTISYDDVANAVTKMVRFYQNMIQGNYGEVRENVSRRFLNLNAEVGEESKVIFILYTSAPKGGIRKDKVEKVFNLLLNNSNKYVLQLFYADDICDEIKEAESRRPTIESGKIKIDFPDNYLKYGDDAVIVNASAFSIKELYATHGFNLLSRNLRYHINNGTNIDRAIKETIANDREMFWFKNNGLTIICDDFYISGNQAHLKNFSIVNGGQTTYNLYKSSLNKDTDFSLPCKIIKISGNTEDEKNLFALEIAKATNSQKAIKPVDLKANSPEQIRFGKEMRSLSIFYQTKRGETVPKEYKEDYKNTDLSEVGKLCLAAIFQLPATSRNKPSSLYNPEYYEPIFNGNQHRIASLTKELLYIDYYFRNWFLKKFDVKYQNDPNANELIPFAHNARTACISFVAFACRYKNGNITIKDLTKLFANIREGAYSLVLYDIFKNIDNFDSFFPNNVFGNKDLYDSILFRLFEGIIKAGRRCYSQDKRYDSTLNESNYLKKDNNYYNILKIEWDNLKELIDNIFNELKNNEY